MTSVLFSGASPASRTWGKEQTMQVMEHPAWRGEISSSEAEALLKNHPDFTYLLRSSGEEGVYYLSFVDPNIGTLFNNLSCLEGIANVKDKIHHQRFELVNKFGGWDYKNLIVAGPRQPQMPLQDLIPLMMKCQPRHLVPLERC